MTDLRNKTTCYIIAAFFFTTTCYSKNTSINASFTVVSTSNGHFSFIAAVNSSDIPVNYYWNFGDGSWLYNTDIANHSFAVTGVYTVKLVVTNPAGESDTAIQAVNAYRFPDNGFADFMYSPAVIYADSPVVFTNNTSSSGSTAARYWNFGDGTYANNTENPVHIYTAPGVYSIRLTAGNDTTVKTIRVLKPGVHAGFNIPMPICRNTIMQFYDQSFSSNGAITSWYWQFGDGATSFEQNPVYTYTYPGSYIITLIAQDITGQRDTFFHNIHITPLVSANFTYTPTVIYTGDSVQLTDISTRLCIAPGDWQWTVRGPLNNSTFNWSQHVQAPPPVVFPSPGEYDVMLFAGDTARKTITVYNGSKMSICPGGTAYFYTRVSGNVFYWDESTDGGITYHSLQDDAHFSGVGTELLTVTNTPSSWYGNLYRCFIDGIPATRFKLEFANSALGTGVWEDTGNWYCQALPDANTDIVIVSGTVTINSNAVCRSLMVMPGANIIVSQGFSLTVLH